MKRTKNILITGGAGFIGSALIRHIIQTTNYHVLNIDKLTYASNLNALSSIENSSRYEFKQIDICEDAGLLDIFKEYDPDLIMHLAAETHVDKSIDSPSDFIRTNIIGTYNLLEQTRKYLTYSGKGNFRFHHISTDEVFGDLPHPENISDNASDLPFFTETSPYNPSSPYSASKASSDHLVRSWFRTFNLPTIITNCSNNYGPFQFREKLIPMCIMNALENKNIPIYGMGNQIRDWLFVDDHAKALLIVALQGKIGSTYNIGGHNEIKNLDVVYSICKILDQLSPKNNSYADQITFVSDRPGHDMRYAIDASKIEKDLDWKPEETFHTGLKKTVEWYLKNVHQYDEG